jgi:hypothetical protein
VQHLLQLSRHPGFLENLLQPSQPARFRQNHVRPLRLLSGTTPMDIPPEIPLLLGHFRNLPPYFSTISVEKTRAHEVTRALASGRPYQALYAAVASEETPDARRILAGRDGARDYDRDVRRHQGFLNFRLRGESTMAQPYVDFADVQAFSDLLLTASEPVAKMEQRCTGSNPSGVVRKYTDPIRKCQFGSATMLVYQLSTSAERYDTHEKNPDSKTKERAGRLRNVVAQTLSGMTWDERKEQSATGALHLAGHLEKTVQTLFAKYGGPHSNAWKLFLEEVEARTLALLLLTVRKRSAEG